MENKKEPKKDLDIDALLEEESGTPQAVPSPSRRDASPMLRRIPVTLTLEVGSADVSLHDLISIEPGTVIELDRLAGEPLVIKVNGIQIGRAEVVIAGDNYGLKVVELEELGLDCIA